MAIFSADSPTKVVTLHKNTCQRVQRGDLRACGCSAQMTNGSHHWCEQHAAVAAINQFMNNRHWAILLCSDCFKDRIPVGTQTAREHTLAGAGLARTAFTAAVVAYMRLPSVYICPGGRC